jgi:hypothetical protein
MRQSLGRLPEITVGLDTVELVIDVENAFGISIPDTDAGGLYTVGDLQQYVVAARAQMGRPLTPEDVWSQLCDILEHGYAIQRKAITTQARIVTDLGLD